MAGKLMFKSLSGTEFRDQFLIDDSIVMFTPQGVYRTKLPVLKGHFVDELQDRIALIETAGGGTVGGVWPTARTITLTGAVNGSIDIDGSQDVSIVTSIPAGSLSVSQVSGLSTTLIGINTTLTGINSRLTAVEASVIGFNDDLGLLTEALDAQVAETQALTNQVSTLSSNVEAVESRVEVLENSAGGGGGVHTHNAFANDVTLAGDLLPDQDNVRCLGAPNLMWRDVYIGPGSLYINGQKILEDTLSGAIRFTADLNQGITIQTSGTGDIELIPSGSGVIQFKGPVIFDSASKIRSSNGAPIKFDDNLQFVIGNGFVGTVTIDDNIIWHAGNFNPNLKLNSSAFTANAVVGFLSGQTVEVGTLNATTVNVVGDSNLGGSVGTFVEIGTIGAFTTALTSTASLAADQVLATIDASKYRSGEFRIQAHNAATGRYHTATLLVVHNGVTANYTEFGDIDLGGRCGDFNADFFNGQMRLLVTPFLSSPTSFKVMMMLTEL